MPVFMPPVLIGTGTPLPESTAGVAGAAATAADSAHAHPRLSSSSNVVLDGSGLATVTFTRIFPSEPVIALCPVNPAGQQVVLEVVTFIQTGAVYTGCTIKGRRAQLLPALSGIILIGPLITALSGFDPNAGAASGVKVCCIALMPS
jgi:hypothetical protein